MEPHILIAEDESYTRLTLSLILRKAGYRVSLAPDGTAALATLKKAAMGGPPVDLLLTDIQMPGLSGMELIDALTAEGIRIPMVVITGYGDKEMVVELMRRGCSEYLDKPFTPEDVTARVAEVLARRNPRPATRVMAEERLRQDRTTEQLRFRLDAREREIQSAKDSHEHLIQLPRKIRNLSLALHRHAFSELGGDFFDIRETATGCDILVADVAGHDMGASYHTVLLKAFFDESGRSNGSGETLFHHLNAQLVSTRNDRMITALFLRIDCSKGSIAITGAAHPSPVLLPKNEAKAMSMAAKGDVIGLWPDANFITTTYRIHPSDRIFLFTDGLLQATAIDGPTGKRTPLGNTGICRLADQNAADSLTDQTASIWKKVFDFCNHKPTDDMLLAGIQIPTLENNMWAEEG